MVQLMKLFLAVVMQFIFFTYIWIGQKKVISLFLLLYPAQEVFDRCTIQQWTVKLDLCCCFVKRDSCRFYSCMCCDSGCAISI